MSFTSQLIIIIIHYASLLGLLICGSLSLIHSDRRKKLLFLILTFLFVGILSFVYYSGILVFIVGVFVIFFLVSLYLFVFQIEFFGSKTNEDQDARNNNKIKKTIGGIILPVLFSAGIGYLFYIYTSDFLKDTVLNGNIYIVGLGDISKQFFIEYGPIMVIVIASLFISFLWFIMISKD
ncbi:MAG TPA: hypothetical protein VIH07_04180 [Candidatus Humimicrobiaceae bacterium]